jgi:Zn finger protein HypA/HybF involved in hydrogenase expression
MGESTGQSKPQTLYCSFCKDEFLTYKAAGAPECPRCGRPVRSAVPGRRLLRFIAVAILMALAVAAVLAFSLAR